MQEKKALKKDRSCCWRTEGGGERRMAGCTLRIAPPAAGMEKARGATSKLSARIAGYESARGIYKLAKGKLFPHNKEKYFHFLFPDLFSKYLFSDLNHIHSQMKSATHSFNKFIAAETRFLVPKITKSRAKTPTFWHS